MKRKSLRRLPKAFCINPLQKSLFCAKIILPNKLNRRKRGLFMYFLDIICSGFAEMQNFLRIMFVFRALYSLFGDRIEVCVLGAATSVAAVLF